jgi:hypothetical protein
VHKFFCHGKRIPISKSRDIIFHHENSLCFFTRYNWLLRRKKETLGKVSTLSYMHQKQEPPKLHGMQRYIQAPFFSGGVGGGGKQNGLVRSCRKEAGDWRLRFLEDESISRHHRYGMAGPLRSSSCDSTFLVVHCELTTNNFVQCSGQGIYTNPSA